nr:hypothetical protein [Caenispirillum bisanense]
MALPEPLTGPQPRVGPQLDAVCSGLAGVAHGERQQAHRDAGAAALRQHVEVAQLEGVGAVGGGQRDAAREAAGAVVLRHPEPAAQGGEGGSRRSQIVAQRPVEEVAAGEFAADVMDQAGHLPAVRIGAVANLHESPLGRMPATPGAQGKRGKSYSQSG